MQEEFFMNSMEKDPKLSGEHGAQTRKSLALKAEEILGLDLETVVADDDLMYDSLMKLKPLENPKKNPMQNALRKYYYYRNGKEFPRLNNYQRRPGTALLRRCFFLYPFFRRCHMGIKSLFGFGQARDKPVDKAADAGYSFLFGRTTSGKPVNERTAMQTTAVYACVRILAEAVASLPLHVYEYQDDGGKKLVHDHPLYYLLHDEPNPEMTSFVFRETLMSHLLIWGNAYAQIIRDGAGRVLGLYPLLPDKMEVQRDDKGNIYYVYSRNSDENPTFKEYGNIKLKAEDVLHIPGLGFDGLIGYSPIAMAKNAVGMTLACEEYGASFFANGANPGGVLEHPGVLKDPSKVRESWNSVYRGVSNAHKIAVLEEGMKYQQIGIPPEEAQFLETRKFQINEIARLYRIPPHMVGDLDKSSFSNIEQQSLEFVKYTLDPWVIRWEQSLQRSLLLPGEKGKYFIKLNVDGLLRGDYQSRMNGYAVGRQNGWFSANDIREMENMNPIPDEEGGNLYLINGAMTKLADAGAFVKTDTGQQSAPAQENSGKRGKR